MNMVGVLRRKEHLEEKGKKRQSCRGGTGGSPSSAPIPPIPSKAAEQQHRSRHSGCAVYQHTQTYICIKHRDICTL